MIESRGREPRAAEPFAYLRRDGVSLLASFGEGRLPSILHWGEDLGDRAALHFEQLALATSRTTVQNDIDQPEVVELLPLQSSGWRGLPGLEGSADGDDWSPRFTLRDCRTTDYSFTATAEDRDAGLEITIHCGLLVGGLLELWAELTRTGTTPYQVHALRLALPLPDRATDLLDLAGRWGRERVPQRMSFPVGVHLRDSRRGRTGADASLVMAAGTSGFSFQSGEVWTIHTAWSGNHTTYAERCSTGRKLLGGSELLAPGEIILRQSETYRTPAIYGAWGTGLDAAAARFHLHLRSRPNHPRTPRLVTLNTWEAVYFDHDAEKLRELVLRAANIGVELFVLDDGWFRGRRDARAGLGDWFVDESVWPAGLTPIREFVRSKNMRFGLWVEPEMINIDSDLARQNPNWILKPSARLPIESRHQQVLDLARPECYAYLIGRISSLVDEYEVDYLKWDHNRDLLEAGSSLTGRPGVHAHTLAVYRMMDELRERHPHLEIESCSSGGGPNRSCDPGTN